MDGKYTRLKLKMLLLVVLGTLIAGGVGLFLLEVVVDGVLQDPFARFFLWAATTLFGQSPEGAAELYQRYIRNNKQGILSLGTLRVMLLACYRAMGRFTRWLDDIRSATRRLVEAQAEPVELPRELAPIQEDLNAIQRQLRAREAAARESEQRKGYLVAVRAHDLKTPLASLVGYRTRLRDDPGLDAAQRAKFTGIALDKARRLEELLGEFFDITRMDLDSGPGERQPIQLSMLLEQLAAEFYPLFAEKQLRCTVEIQHPLVVLGDPDKLARVFDNVLRNAVSYSTPGGRVDIQAKTVGRQAEITIRNEGLEIPEGELANIFQKFYRLDAARSSRTGGAGLGLAPGGRVDVAFYPQINEFRGTRSVQLQVADLHPAPTRAQAERAVYEKYRRGEGLTPAEARLLMPSRAEFVGLWRYLQRRCAGLGRVEDTAPRIARGASRAPGPREAAQRVLLCPDVLAERGLIDLETGPQGVAVSLRQVERKVDLEASPILGRLRQAIRGGSAAA